MIPRFHFGLILPVDRSATKELWPLFIIVMMNIEGWMSSTTLRAMIKAGEGIGLVLLKLETITR